MSLADQIAGPRGDLLGLSRILAEGGVGADRGEGRRSLMMRFQSAAGLRGSLERLRAAGYLGVVARSEGRLFEAVAHYSAKTLPLLLPVVPNLQGFMRDAVEDGMLKTGLRRAMRVNIISLAGLGLRGIGRASALARGEFPAMLQSLIELELADFAKFNPPVVFLQSQMTDLALSMHNPRILEAFFDTVRNRTGAVPGLVTQNLGTLMAALKTWGLENGAAIVPWSLSGAGMRPDVETCRHAAKASDFPVWADRGGRPEPPSPEERESYRKYGLSGAMRDDLGLWLGA